MPISIFCLQLEECAVQLPGVFLILIQITATLLINHMENNYKLSLFCTNGNSEVAAENPLFQKLFLSGNNSMCQSNQCISRF